MNMMNFDQVLFIALKYLIRLKCFVALLAMFQQ